MGIAKEFCQTKKALSLFDFTLISCLLLEISHFSCENKGQISVSKVFNTQ